MSETVYLLHFDRPYRHARHYLGYTRDLDARLAAHAAGQGARLLQVLRENNIGWHLARTWDGGRALERRLKALHAAAKLCPDCGYSRYADRPRAPEVTGIGQLPEREAAASVPEVEWEGFDR
ncbi:hypothetical protein [Nocardia sp. CC227C]|uniref:hypothetical protein n=1 Tax=Nocardia sp. CC227C TaxID=3044562 RepID=UPI00278BD997|nr:hypothetical protein [Nocardia sp. CC227C]